MELNIFFEAIDSIEGYQTKLLQKIDEEVHFNKCICTVKCADDSDHYDSDKYVAVDYEICERNRYAEKYDMNALIPLDREILEKMLPYESTAMQMLVRNMEQDIYTYDESKRLYLQHLRFWNHMFVTYHINFVFQICVPHHAHDYIIYGLAKVYGCGHVINEATSIWNHWLPVHDLYAPNTELMSKYEQYRNSSDEIILSDYVEHYYQALLFENRNMDKNLLNAGKSRKQHIADQKKVYECFFYSKNRWKRNKSNWKKLFLDGILKGNGEEIAKQREVLRQDSDYKKRARIKKHQMRSVKYYDSLAGAPDYDEKYVIYFLHYQPEATTLPQAGVFANQELVIALLADSLQEMGIKLYVKEHFVQPYRNKAFYDAIKNMPNVTLIRSDIDSKELLIHSVATSTCNGTILQESIFNNKPVLTFGYGPFNGAPGTFQCSKIEDIANAIKQIQKSELIQQHDVRAYLKAFDECSVYTNIYPSMKTRKCDLSMDESIDNMKNCVVEQVEKYGEW